MSKKEGYSRKGLFGEIKHYDANGRKVGESRPNILGRHFRNYEKRPLVQGNCPKRYSFSQTGSFTRGDRPQSI